MNDSKAAEDLFPTDKCNDKVASSKARQMGNTDSITTEMLKLYKSHAWQKGFEAGIKYALKCIRTPNSDQLVDILVRFKDKLRQEFLDG